MNTLPNRTTLTGESILVLDFGSQYAQLIARRVREQNVFCEIVRNDISADRVLELNPKGLILSGGPSSVYESQAPQCDPKIFQLGLPVLGICYGMQLACQALGSDIDAGTAREYGRISLHISPGTNPLFANISEQTTVWMSHGDQVLNLGKEFVSLGTTPTCPFAAVKHQTLPVYGLQFHPEVTHTPDGSTILHNFLHLICQCQGNWKMDSFAETTIEGIKEKVGNRRVICGLSGGVDSAVTAALLDRAIGKQLICILVDNGLLRQGEVELVTDTFNQHFNTDLHVSDAADRFLKALDSVVDPQEKRRIIGHSFIDVFREEAEPYSDAEFLAQGTLYPDVIESGATADGPAATIKLHHNVGGLPEELGLTLVEPLRNLFKDEVRRLGSRLGLPDEMIWRHPFPGPGLAVRCLGAVTRDRLERLRLADAIVVEEIRRAKLYRQTSQVFAVLLPVQSVGVMGDARTYSEVIAIRAVETEDFMTADWVRLPYEVLAVISSRIINEVPDTSRVVYDISSKPPATIEWE